MKANAKNIYAKKRDARRPKASLIGHLRVANLVPFDSQIPEPPEGFYPIGNTEGVPASPNEVMFSWLKLIGEDYPNLYNYLLSTASGLELSVLPSEVYFNYSNFKAIRSTVNSLIDRHPGKVVTAVLATDSNGLIRVEPLGVSNDFIDYELERFRRCPKCKAAFYGRSNQTYCSPACRSAYLVAVRRQDPVTRAEENKQRRANYSYARERVKFRQG